MRIVFMGTPDFAVPSLTRLLADGHEIVGVVTRPDRPQGRHQTLTPPPVKVLALEQGLLVLQPPDLRDTDAQQAIAALRPELIVVAAYGKILPRVLLDLPSDGCINVHGSLLPAYRGAAPIQWSVIRNEPKTGVTIMRMAQGLDTGDLLLQCETPIGATETAGELFERLAVLGAHALSQAITRLDTLTPTPQDDALACWAPPLQKADGEIRFTSTQSAVELFARIRGVTPRPGAFATLTDGRRVKIHRAALAPSADAVPGTLLDSKRLLIACADGALELLDVQLDGAKRIDGAQLLNGQRLTCGAKCFD